jgi:hypothetical protein
MGNTNPNNNNGNAPPPDDKAQPSQGLQAHSFLNKRFRDRKYLRPSDGTFIFIKLWGDLLIFLLYFIQIQTTGTISRVYLEFCLQKLVKKYFRF